MLHLTAPMLRLPAPSRPCLPLRHTRPHAAGLSRFLLIQDMVVPSYPRPRPATPGGTLLAKAVSS